MSTVNFGLNLPASGSAGWDVPLNANWETLDAELAAASGAIGQIDSTSVTTFFASLSQNQEVAINHQGVTNERIFFCAMESASGNREIASLGRYGSSADYGIKRVSPSLSYLKKQSAGTAATLLSVIVGN